MLVDQFGRPVAAFTKPETREISTALLRDRYSTYPSSGLAPVRLANILKAADQGDVLRQAELFEEMEEKDAHLASQFQTRKLAIQGLSWEMQPASEDSSDKKIAEFCREIISELSDLDDHILDALDALPKGYSMLEIMWDTSSGEAAITELKWLHPKKITFWDSLTPRILTEEDPVRGVDPPPFKFVYHRYKARSGYDTRAGIMRVCAWMYLFKNYAIKDWVAFSEVYGMPLRVGKYEPGASKGDKDALLDAIRSLGSDAAGIISKSTEIEFIESQKSSSGSGQNIYESLVRFCDAQISKAILGQTLTSEAGGDKGQGSLALGKVHGDVRQDLIEADCRSLGKTFTMQILRPLVGFNFGWDAPVPTFKFCYEPPEDLKAAADVYQIICGNLGKPVSVEHLSERFKIPMPAEGETLLVQPARQIPPGSPPQPQQIAKLIAKDLAGATPTDIAAQMFIDRATGQILPDAETAMRAMLKPVLDMIDKADSIEEIGAKLYALYPQLDGRRFQELLARAMFDAAVAGSVAQRGDK